MFYVRLFLTLAAFLGLVLPSAAQTAPQYDRSQLPVGAAYSWETSLGLSKAVNLGFDGQVYLFKFTDLAADGREAETIYATNQQGRLVWYSFDGQTESFLPHDCSFVTERCESRIERNGALVGSAVTTAHYADGIWFHTEVRHNDGQAPMTTTVCGIHDQDSIFQALYVSYSDSDTPYWLRITSGPNAERSREMLVQVAEACQRARPNA